MKDYFFMGSVYHGRTKTRVFKNKYYDYEKLDAGAPMCLNTVGMKIMIKKKRKKIKKSSNAVVSSNSLSLITASEKSRRCTSV